LNKEKQRETQRQEILDKQAQLKNKHEYNLKEEIKLNENVMKTQK